MNTTEALKQLRDDIKEWVTNNLNAIGKFSGKASDITLDPIDGSDSTNAQEEFERLNSKILVPDYENKLVNAELLTAYTAVQNCFISVNAVNDSGVTMSINEIDVITSTALSVFMFLQKNDVVKFTQNARISIFGAKS